MDDDSWVWLILAPFILTITIIIGIAWYFYKFLWWVWQSPKRITIFWGIINGFIAGLTVFLAIGSLLSKVSSIGNERIVQISLGIGVVIAGVTMSLYFQYLAPNIYRLRLLTGHDNHMRVPVRHELAGRYNRYGEID